MSNRDRNCRSHQRHSVTGENSAQACSGGVRHAVVRDRIGRGGSRGALSASGRLGFAAVARDLAAHRANGLDGASGGVSSRAEVAVFAGYAGLGVRGGAAGIANLGASGAGLERNAGECVAGRGVARGRASRANPIRDLGACGADELAWDARGVGRAAERIGCVGGRGVEEAIIAGLTSAVARR